MIILLTEPVNHCVSRPDNMPDKLLAQGISLQASGSSKRRDESQAKVLTRKYARQKAKRSARRSRAKVMNMALFLIRRAVRGRRSRCTVAERGRRGRSIVLR